MTARRSPEPLVLDAADVLALSDANREAEGHRHGGAVARLLASLLDALGEHERVEVLLRTASSGRPAGTADFEGLIQEMTPDVPMASEAVARQAQRNAVARAELLQEFGVLTSEQIGERHSHARNRHALAARWRKEGRLFAVTHHGRTLFPAFQFEATSGDLRTAIREALSALPTERMSDWEIALWWTASNGWLGGRRPVDLLDDDPAAIAAVAARLARPTPL